jgi:hypothetical protein
MVYALISAVSLWLLSRQIRDARRFGAAPALYALLKELDEHMAAVRQLGDGRVDDTNVRETVNRCLDFFERVEHMRSAGVIPTAVLRRAFGNALDTQLADPRFTLLIEQSPREHEEVLILAGHICTR